MNKKSVSLSDLIPITAHYDTSTLITKNGELVQILSIKGFSKRFDKHKELNLRDEIRKLLRTLLSKNMMFYIYVKRDYRKIDIAKEFTSELAMMKHQMWIKDNSLEYNLMNTLYIAIVHIGAKESLSKTQILKHIFFNKMRDTVAKILDKAATDISNISLEILQSLEKYGAELLSLTEKNGQLISQPLSFIHYLIHSQEKEVEVKKVDFAKILSYNLEIKNSYNTSELIVDNGIEVDFEGNVEISSSAPKSHYISLLTLKSGYDLPTKYTDQILNLCQKMVITETIKLSTVDTLSKKLASDRKTYEFMKVDSAMKLSDFLLKGADKIIRSQLSLKVVGETPEELEANVAQTKSLLNKIGVCYIVEDLYMLSNFYSILPGNSHLLRREYMTIPEISSIFCSIKPKSLGGYNGSIWGFPITIFRTTDNLPFFFNFHNYQNIGHTIIVGRKEYGLDALVSFLISESFRLEVKVVDLFSADNDLEALHNSLNVGQTQDRPSVNLIKMLAYKSEEFYKILEFVLLRDEPISQELKIQIISLLSEIIEKLKIEGVVEDIVKDITELIYQKIPNSDIQSKLSAFFRLDIFFKFFYNDSHIDQNFFKSNLSDLISDYRYNRAIVAIVSFLMIQKIMNELDEVNITPVIINISADVLDLYGVYKEEFLMILDTLSKKHVVIIFNCSDKDTLYKIKGLSELIREKLSLKIFLSDKFVDRKFKELFDLSHLEINKIKMYNPSEKIFLMKQDDHSISCSFKALNKTKH